MLETGAAVFISLRVEMLVTVGGGRGIIGERARHYQGCTNSRFARYTSIYIRTYLRHNSSASTY